MESKGYDINDLWNNTEKFESDLSKIQDKDNSGPKKLTGEVYESPIAPKSIADAAFVSAWDFTNAATMGVSTLAAGAALGNTEFYQDFTKYRKEAEDKHKVAGFLSSTAGSIVPFLLPEEGLIFSALKAPVKAAEFASGAFEASSVAKTLTNPLLRKTVNGALQGSIYGGFGGIAQGINEADITGVNADSFKSVMYNSITGAGEGAAFGAAFGAATELVKGTFRASKTIAMGDAEVSYKVPHKAKEGIAAFFDSAIKSAKDEKIKQILNDSHSEIKKALETLEKYESDPEFSSTEEFKKANLLLNITLGSPDFVSRLYSSRDPIDVKNLWKSGNNTIDLQKILSSELGIPIEEVHVRDDLITLINKDLKYSTDVDASINKNAESIQTEYMKATDSLGKKSSPASSPQLQASQLLDTYKTIHANLENVKNPLENENKAIISSNKSLPRSALKKSTKKKTALEKQASEYEMAEKKGYDPAIYDKLHKNYSGALAKSIVSLESDISKGSTQSDLYSHLQKTIKTINKHLTEAKADRDVKITPEVANLHSSVRSPLADLSNNSALWGKPATSRQKLYHLQSKKMGVRSAFEKVIKQKNRKTSVSDITYDESGVASVKDAGYTDFHLNAISALKTIGKGTGNIEKKFMAPKALKGYLNNLEKIMEHSIDTLDAHLETLSSKILSTKNAALKKTLLAQKKSLQVKKEELIKQLTGLKKNNSRVNRRLEDLRAYNSKNSQNFSNMIQTYANSSRINSAATGDGKRSVGHGNVTYRNELTYLVKDTLDGNNFGRNRAAMQLAMLGASDAFNKIAEKIGSDMVSPEVRFLTAKNKFLEQTAKNHEKIRMSKIRTNKFKKIKGIDTAAAGASAGSLAGDSND